MKVVLFGASGRVGRVLVPALEAAGHAVTGVGRGEEADPAGHDAAVDFTRPDAVRANVEGCLAAGVPCVVGTTGLTEEGLAALRSVLRPGDCVLVKGSRAMGLEAIAEALAVVPVA